MDRGIEKEYERLKKKLVNRYFSDLLEELEIYSMDTDFRSKFKEVEKFDYELAGIDEEAGYKFLDKIEKIKEDLYKKVWEDIERNALEEFDRISEFEPIRDKLRRRAEELCSE